jgi:hypothetical protein
MTNENSNKYDVERLKRLSRSIASSYAVGLLPPEREFSEKAQLERSLGLQFDPATGVISPLDD